MGLLKLSILAEMYYSSLRKFGVPYCVCAWYIR